MKFMKTINEIQAALTKLRREVRGSEAGTKDEKIIPDILKGQPGDAKTATEVAMQQISESYDLYRWLNGKTDKKPPIADKILTRLMKDDLQEKEGQLKGEIIRGIVDDLCGTLDLPLHVRVAKALGNNVKYRYGDDPAIKIKWWIEKWDPGDVDEDCKPVYYTIPDYPNDLVAAMGALEEYQNGFDVWIYRYAKWETQWRVNFGNGLIVIDNDSLPQAICEAIVAHAEEK